MKTFCYNCGTKIEFSAANKPKFCMNCGTSLDPSKASGNIEATERSSEDDSESEEASFSGNISELDFDFVPDSQNKIKIQDALGSGSQNQHQEPKLNSPNISKEEFDDQWSKEAGSLRSGSSQKGDE